MSKVVQEIEHGTVVDSKLVDLDGNLYVKQYAENKSDDVRHELLVTGGRVAQNLEGDITPRIPIKQYNKDVAIHTAEYIEGDHPETDKEWRQVGKTLNSLHEQNFERLNYGQFQGYTNYTHVGLFRAYHHWNEFLDTNINAYLSSSQNELIENQHRQVLEEGWDKSKVPKEPEKAVLHNDLVPSNTLIDDDECYLIDFDQSIHGDPLFDLIKAEETLAIRGIDPRPLTQGYGQINNVSEELEKSYRAYTLSYEAWSTNITNQPKAERILDRIDEI